MHLAPRAFYGHRVLFYFPSEGTELDRLTGMRVVVDFDLCESNALCMAAAPDVFEVRGDDFLYVLQEEPPEELHDKVRAAARSCPKAAISIID
jgi:ferredoxin